MALSGTFFDANYYLEQNADVAANWSGTAMAHYEGYGASEGRAPNAWFDFQFYRANNTDLQSFNALELFEHYEAYGWAEGRVTDQAYANFDEEQYLTDYSDLGTGGITASTALNHYLTYGESEGRTAKNDDGSVISGSSTTAGQTYTLTTGADALTGTTGNDTFGGTNTTFQSIDTINGGGGTDTLNLALAGNYGGGATVQNVEGISITGTTGAGTTFNAIGIAGLTTLTNNSTSATGLTYSNVGSVANVNVTNTALLTTVGYTESAVAGSSDAVTVTLNGVTGGAASAISLNSGTANSVGIETVNIVSSGTSNSTQLNTNDTAGLATVNISGDQNLSLIMGTNVTTTAKTLNASAATGNVTLSTLGKANHTITGGTGNDTFDLNGVGGTYTAADAIDGGDGIDTLQLHNTDATGVTKAVSNVTNVELIDVAALNGAANALFFGATGVTFSTAMAASSTAVVGPGTGSLDFQDQDITTGGNFTLGVGTTGTATNDVLNWNIGTSTGDMDSSGSGAITLSGFETVNLSSIGDGGGNTFAGAVTLVATAGASTKLVITGDEAIDFAAAVTADTVDASGLDGVGLTMDATNGGGVQMNITGSAKADTIEGSTASDLIKGGAAGDTFEFTATAGSAADTLIFADGDSISKADVANGFLASITDSFTGVVVDAGHGAAAGSKFTLDTAQSATAISVNTTAVTLGTSTVTNAYDFYVFHGGTTSTDTYIYQDTDGDKVIEAGEFAIKIVGNAADWTDDAAAGWAVSGGNLVFTSQA